MIVRGLDSTGDWLFGKGKNDYLSGNAAVAQDIQTRVQCFLGDCFFDVSSGIDWWNLLQRSSQIALNLAISSTILNTENVTGINQLYITLNADSRSVSIGYDVQTTYSVSLSNEFSYDLELL